MAAERFHVGSRKGLMTFVRTNDGWTVERVSHAGIPVTYACHDDRNGVLWASLDHGHWGQKLSRSSDGGEAWEEVEAPKYPQNAIVRNPFDEGPDRDQGKPATLENIWVIQPGGADQPQRLYLGTNPGGLFRSDDGGKTFDLVSGLWNHPSRLEAWFGGGRDTPGIHSIVVDPRDSKKVLVGISVAGVFASEDDGDTWQVRNQGLEAPFLPDPQAEVGHDPHFVMPCASSPDILWQQNHCGIFRSEDEGRKWKAIHQEKGPANFGFAVAAHANEPGTAWVVPAVSDEQRMAIGGALMVCRTEDGGESWTELREGLPQTAAYDVVYRHALDIDGDSLVFGSTTGNVYVSEDRGDTWQCVSNNLPPVYSVRFGA